MGVRIGVLSTVAAVVLVAASAGAVAADYMKITGVSGDWIAVTSFAFDKGRGENGRGEKRSATVTLPRGPADAALIRALTDNKILREVMFKTVRPDGKVETTYVLSNVAVTRTEMSHDGAQGSEAHEEMSVGLAFQKVEIQNGG